ncbi:protein SMAX1-LIKE 6-like isoform X1 [Lycium barbarum]|uniref:protein SMAX1-LIKE 6-like isoform X1 n=1 Tax=Lycium barbarum TaxID=112863 RepID=UPI00293E3CC1|nr:protein SMAX1-LIKE 6-like isoform X1 [Lycium barbarum]
MPTPVSAARRCLTEEAARALDDAVCVARRRSHAQTTSLHAVSALLSLPSSTLRDACARARSCASYSPRLQFRALELSVSVSLDRLPTAKTLDAPPISNSLMAAIKRSQANQRRHPDTFHIYQQLQQQNSSNFSISTLKVELKHFILSILDDPIVSRVFGEAGFRSCDIKLAILNPPAISRFSKTRCPPLFLCNLTDSELNKRGFNFPFSGVTGKDGNIDENSRRIGEILVKKSCRNPLLIGICATDALYSFTDCVVQKGKGGGGVLPDEIKGLSVISIEKEITEFVMGGGSEEMMRLKFKEVSDAVECCCEGAGIIVNYGALKVFIDDGSVESVNYIVSRFSKLVQLHCGKLWLVGAAASYDIYMKFLARFPTIQKDWDLHLLPITSSTPSRSSLMGSFVPFGGFFSAASEFENSWINKNESTARCNLCNEKYEQEVSIVLRGATGSVTDQHAAYLSSWLQKADCGPSRGLVEVEADEDRSLLNARLAGLQKKWNDICQRLHHIHPFQPDALQARSQHPSFGIFQSSAAGGESSNKDSLLDARFTSQSSMSSDLQNTSLTKKPMSKSVVSEGDSDSQAEVPAQTLETQKLKIENILNSYHHAPRDLSLPLDRTSSASNASVSTDLGLGTIYISTVRKPSFQEHQDRLHYFSGSVSSSSSIPQLDKELDATDFKNLYKALSEHAYWQEEAIYAISHTVSRCRSGNGRRHGSSKGNTWLSFLGPDKVGKQKIAKALAENVFGSCDSLLSVDLSSSDGISCSNSLLNHQNMRNGHVNLRGKTVVDYIAEELSKKRCSIVLLENIEKADFLVQNSLSRAIRTGKFLNLHGKEISINNMIFVITSKSSKVTKDFFSSKKPLEFSEEKILAAKNLQMQIAIGSGNRNRIEVKNTNLWITSGDRTSESLSAYKRKQTDNSDSYNDKLFQMPKRVCTVPKSSLDLNLPVEEEEAEENQHDECDSDSGSEGSKAWLEEILEQMDDNVVFKPFNFGALAEKILKEININLQEIVGVDIKLEIDSEVMVQILAAAWLSDRKEAVDDWVEKVLCRSFMEVRSRFQHITDSVIRLVNCQGIAVEDQAPGLHLPAKITLD